MRPTMLVAGHGSGAALGDRMFGATQRIGCASGMMTIASVWHSTLGVTSIAAAMRVGGPTGGGVEAAVASRLNDKKRIHDGSPSHA
ncbi:hypothetical protein WT83_05010 [Burkholderia territorii]|uniref:Uncharacterized protein n=1 Tax=Burkholderia territorii TaxID=1503055 RepID=A0A108F2T9_9BURK|nr:hypothetical protein WT83_05010 [Burkholderia territorii]